jgi:hypothetical protein
MRQNQFVALLAGSLLAATVAAPSFVFAAPERVEAVSPLPPARPNARRSKRSMPRAITCRCGPATNN